MEKEQTAVEWLIDQLEQKGNASVNMSIGRMVISIKENEYIDLIQQAKYMEKEQIIDVYGDGCCNWDSELEGEQYYNKKFGE